MHLLMNRVFSLLVLMLTAFLAGCEEDIMLDIPEGEEMLVVEGHIEQGTPPVILLTRSVPVFSSISKEAIAQSFVHEAQVVVSTTGRSFSLKEVSSASFTVDQKRLLSEQFSIPPHMLQPGSGYLFYIYTADELLGEAGKSYALEISYKGKLITSSTTIPHPNPLETIWTVPHPDPAQDSLVTLMYRYKDPDTLGNSVRYFTKRNSEPFYPGPLTSVFNDELINGGILSFPLERGEPKGQQEVDMTTYGFFGKGDTITIRWCAIDLPHYRFWLTLESEQNNNGSPIGTPNITNSNINGGLGIWGGYGVSYHRIVVDK